MDIQNLLERINNEPSILFLGQAYLGIKESGNIFIKYINEIVLDNAIKDEELTYNSLLKYLDPSRKDQTIKKLLEVSESIPVPEWLVSISKLRWSSIFTSSIDSITQKAFFSYGRQFKSIFSRNDNPRNYMSKSILHGTYLFGNVYGEGIYMPPFSEEELDDKLGDATILLERIADLIENYGLLVIEGYDPDSDWIDPVTLANLLSRFSPGNVFVFSANEAFITNPRLARHIKSGRITVESRSLYECLLEAEVFDEEEFYEPIEYEGVPLTINKELKYLPYQIYNDISQKYILLDDRVLKKVPVHNVEEAFLKFLRESSVRPIWSAYLNGFYFKRVFDDKLKRDVEKELDNEVFDSKTVILRGQNGTGKTVSLCNLAMEIKRGMKYPVIFIPRETTPDTAVLNRFISWLENNMGAERTVIIWDMGAYRSEIYDIISLQKTLNNGGRKVLVVGSSYANGEESNNAVFTDIPHVIDHKHEIPALREVLQKINPAYVNKLESAIPQIGEHGNLFIAAMYELFHDIHTNLAKGVAKEVDKAEKAISRQIREKRLITNVSPFAKLRSIFGLEDINYYTEMSYEIESAIQEVSDLVCVASQYGVDLTLDLLLRIINISDKYEFVKDLSENSMITVIQDGDYNYLVRFRSTLEAQLYAQDRFTGGMKQEIDCVKRIIANIKPYANQNDNIELTQLLNLLFKYSPNGPQKSKYKPYYLTLAGALRELREKQNFFVPSLVLREANFIRESFKGIEDSEEKRKNLKMAQEILREAIDMMRQNGETGIKSYANLLVELASNLADSIFTKGQDYKESLEIYREIKTNLDVARAISPESYQPVDVYLNSSILVYENTDSIDEKNNILADMLRIIDDARHANTEFEDRPEFQSRVSMINQYLNNTEIEESYYLELLKKGSATGVYLRAKKLLGDYSFTISPDRHQYERIEQALNLLIENQTVVFGDARSLLLLIQLYWIKATGSPIFSVEKFCPSLGKAQWNFIDSLCTRYINMETAVPVALPLFLKAVRLFINEEDYKSMDYFEQAKKAPGPRRIPVYLIHCDEIGKPVRYQGKLDSFNNGKGKIKLLHRPIKAHFTARSFPDFITIEKDQEFRNLAIGFNLMGPVAIPIESVGDKHA